MSTMDMNEVVVSRLGGLNTETDYQQQFVECLAEILHDRTPTETIEITGKLIRFLIDNVSSELSIIRRTAAAIAKNDLNMTTHEIAEASNQSIATILRLVTEFRNVGKPPAPKKKRNTPTTEVSA